MFYSLGRLERLILFLPMIMTLFLIFDDYISIIIYYLFFFKREKFNFRRLFLYFVRITEVFLTNVTTINLSIFFRLMMKLGFQLNLLNLLNLPLLRSVDVEMIRHGFSSPGEMTDTDTVDNTNTENYYSQ